MRGVMYFFLIFMRTLIENVTYTADIYCYKTTEFDYAKT